jgi:predicted enzyme related to lactoylglutathione lyase
VQGTDRAVDIVTRGVAIGTLRSGEGKVSPFNGVVYVQVNDVQESCRKARQLGGTVVEGFPFNLTERPGAIGLVVDPAGHPIGLYSRKPLPAATP